MQFIEHNLAHVIASGASLDNYKQHSLRQAYDAIAQEKAAETAPSAADAKMQKLHLMGKAFKFYRLNASKKQNS